MSKIGRNEQCPCGSGKKYKKCCIDKKETSDNECRVQIRQTFTNLNIPLNDAFMNKGKGEAFNKEIHDLLEKGQNMFWNNESEDAILDCYIPVSKYLFQYAKDNNIDTFEGLDEKEIIIDFVNNFFNDLDLVFCNSDRHIERLEYVSNVLDIFKLDKGVYLNFVMSKSNTLFILGRVDEGVALIEDNLKENPKWGFGYVSLVDNFRDILNDEEKAKYYLEKGLAIEDLEDREVLEQRLQKNN